MPVQPIPDTQLKYYLVAYDKDGSERTDDPDGLMSDRVAEAIREEAVTDVFIMSHGWQGDIPGAIQQYDQWIAAMTGCAADLHDLSALRPNFKSLMVGFHWPSKPWGEEEFGMGAASFAAPGAEESPSPTSTSPEETIEKFVRQYAERIADTDRARDAIRTILSGAMNAGPSSAGTLPPEMAEAYRVLNEESDLGAGGLEGAPGDDREPFDPDRAYKNARASAAKPGPGSVGPAAFGGFSFSSLLSPLRQLSFWKMKDRGRKLGQSGGFRLLRKAMSAAPLEKDVRFHLMGHSFGCIVVTSMIVGSNQADDLPRPVNTLTLVQGATSLWGFCDQIPGGNQPGYFRSVIERKRVSGPILTTQSKRDTAVGWFYPIAAGLALQVAFPAGQFPKYGGLGAFGIQGPGLTLHDLLIGEVSHKYGFEREHIYNLECTGVIKDGSGLSGAHCDIAKPEVAHALWEAVKMS